MPGDGKVPALTRMPVTDDAEALYAQGMAHYRRREWNEAKACFARLKSMAPDRRGVDALLNEVDIFIQLQAMEPEQPATAVPTTQTAEAQRTEPVAPETMVRPRATVRRLPWPAIVIALVAVMSIILALYATGGLDKYIDSRRQARVQALVNQGIAAMNVGDCDKAEKLFGESLALAPGNEEVKTWYAKAQRCKQLDSWCKQAEADTQAERWESALDNLDRIIALDPTSCGDASKKRENVKALQALHARFQQAKGYLDQENYSEAITILEQLRQEASSFKPDEVQQTLFNAYSRNGAKLMSAAGDSLEVIAQAIDSFDRALSISPNDKTAIEERRLADLYRQGSLSFRKPDWPEAVRVLQQIHGIRPDYLGGKVASMLCTSHLKLGDAYHTSGDLVQALQQYRDVLAIEACDHVEAETKERELYGILYPPTSTPTSTPLPTRTPRPTATVTPTASPPPPPTAPPPPATPVPIPTRG